MLELIRNVAARYRRDLQSRREMREILDRNDDRMLRDIGLTRADLREALSKPVDLGLRQEMARLSRQARYLDGSRFGARR